MRGATRTTVTLAPDVRALLERRMQERDLTFAEALNGALRSALAAEGDGVPFATPVFSMGESAVPLEKALLRWSEPPPSSPRA